MGVFRDGMGSVRGYIEQLGPYQSLLILAIPTSLVEPLKLIAVAVAGEGHWITGTFMIIAAYGCSLLFVERLFRVVRPKLLTLPWFARLWNWSCLFEVRWLDFSGRANHRSTQEGGTKLDRRP
jgi:hypothetical protein